MLMHMFGRQSWVDTSHYSRVFCHNQNILTDMLMSVSYSTEGTHNASLWTVGLSGPLSELMHDRYVAINDML